MPRPLPFLPILLGLLWGGPVRADDEPPIQVADPNEWSIREYRFPESDLYFSISKDALFDEELYEREQKRRLPDPPSSGAAPADFEEYIEVSTAYMTERLRELGVFVPQGSRILADPATETLAVETDDRLHAILEQVESVRALSLPRFLRSQLDIVEVPTPLAFQILDRLGNTADHGNILQELRDEPRGRWIESGVIESTSEEYLKLSTGDWLDPESEEQTLPTGSGMHLELGALHSPGFPDIALNLRLQTRTTSGHDSHPAQNVILESKHLLATKQRDGNTRLVGCQPGTTGDHHQLLWLRSDRVLLDSPANHLLIQWLGDHPRQHPVAKPGLPSVSDLEDSFVHRVFRLPPDYPDPTAPSNPFAQSPVETQTYQEHLEEQGISFPEGSTAVMTSGSKMLYVNAPKTTHELIEAYFTGTGPEYSDVISLRFRILEAERDLLAPILEHLGASPNHSDRFKEFRALVQSGQATWVTAASIESTSGQRSVCEVQSTDHPERNASQLRHLLIEVDNFARERDQIAIRGNVSVESPTGTKAQFDCDTLLNSGEHRLIGKWIEPTSSNEPEKLRLVWLEAHIVPHLWSPQTKTE